MTTDNTIVDDAAGAALPTHGAKGPGSCLISRRRFLLTSGATTATVMVMMNAGTPLAK